MAFYEAIWEDGTNTVMSGDSDAIAIAAVLEQDRRAQNGESAGPAGGPAKRIKRLLKYTDHPGDWGSLGVSVDVAKSEIKTIMDTFAKDAVVDFEVLVQALRTVSAPVVDKEHPHDSMFKASQVAELDLNGAAA